MTFLPRPGDPATRRRSSRCSPGSRSDAPAGTSPRFGGAIVVLVPDDHAQALGESVLEAYRDRFPAASPSMHLCHASDGAGEAL